MPFLQYCTKNASHSNLRQIRCLDRASLLCPHPHTHLQKRFLARLSADELRHRYLGFFEKNGHTKLQSADIVPKNDPTLLFTNAGMVPFKQYFLDPKTAPYKQITTVQKCVRAGGKHNDLDQVGYTPRHHTFFEMLGNFSFGAYSKREVIRMAWDFITKELQMDPKDLRVSVLDSDDEAYSIWKDEIGFDPKRIARLGKSDNFWSMGDGEGPCGPSSEIFWDTKDPRYTEADEERWLEFWNLVFMQFYRDATGKLQKLETPCIDTGMGLERVASILQGKHNNFDTDVFEPIIGGIPGPSHKEGLTYKRIIADHLRASSFLISEGVYPSNTGKGYVLRRIIRRAVRAGRLLGIDGRVLSDLYPRLEQVMGDAYPELVERKESIVSMLRSEEDVFLKTLEKGLLLLESIFSKAKDSNHKVVSSKDSFTLYDTHGFPIDLTRIIAHENGWDVDIRGFEKMLRDSRERNKASWKGKSTKGNNALLNEIESVCVEWQGLGISSRFSGYELDPESKHGQRDSQITAARLLSNGDAMVSIDPCPFYALGGGQEPDKGYISICDSADNGKYHVFKIKSVQLLPNKRATFLVLKDAADKMQLLNTGQHVLCTIDMKERYGCALHHTATHLLNAALRKVIGPTVIQAGSLVRSDGLRFDFTSNPLSKTQIQEIEDYVNQVAIANTSISSNEMPLEEAKAQGALATFAEKYNSDRVRVVSIGDASRELCGGTHLQSTRSVFPFQILTEGSIGAGTRRIEAVAGTAASSWLRMQLGHAKKALDILGTTKVDDMEKKARQLAEKAKRQEESADYWLRTAATNMRPEAMHMTRIGTNRTQTSICILSSNPTDSISNSTSAQRAITGQESMRMVVERAAYESNADPNCAHAVIHGQSIALCVHPGCTPKAHAGDLLKGLFAVLPGKGGGQQSLAQGRLNTPIASIDQIAELL